MIDTVFAVAMNTVIIVNDPGGTLSDYAKQLIEYQQNETRVEIQGYCASACTMYLQIACVHPTAILGFHGASAKGEGNKWMEEWATVALANMYPEALRIWFLENAAELRGDDAEYMTGLMAANYGVELCE